MSKFSLPLPSAASAEILAVQAQSLAGRSLGELAEALNLRTPDDLRRAKGWVGTLMERALGATAGSRAEPDFPELGVELKTLPVDARGKPLESTFVASIELPDLAHSEWSDSRLWRKLACVLWVPVEGLRSVPVAQRLVGAPFLWRPDAAEEACLRADWDGFASLIARGRTGELTGHLGEVLQVRPKAARGSSRRRTLGEEGGLYDEQPKGFYLRAGFTHSLVCRRFGLTEAARGSL